MTRLCIILFFLLVCASAEAKPQPSLATLYKEAQAAQLDFKDQKTVDLLRPALKHAFDDINDLKNLIDAHLLLALAFKNLGKASDMDHYLKEASRLDPHYDPSELYFPPSLLLLLAKAQNNILEKGQFGALLIESRPKGAQVFVNGSFKGSAPLKLNQYPVGEHTITALVDNRSQSKKIILGPGMAKIALRP